eukprot:8859114-Pyramimonas_sp.AAC.2
MASHATWSQVTCDMAFDTSSKRPTYRSGGWVETGDDRLGGGLIEGGTQVLVTLQRKSMTAPALFA